MHLVTLESVKEALEHLEQHNGPGRLREAQTMLKRLILLAGLPIAQPTWSPSRRSLASKHRPSNTALLDGW